MRGAALREVKRWQRHGDHDAIVVSLEDSDFADDRADVERHTLDRLAQWGDGRVADAMIKLSPSHQQIATLRYVDDISGGYRGNRGHVGLGRQPASDYAVVLSTRTYELNSVKASRKPLKSLSAVASTTCWSLLSRDQRQAS